jgi:hypothetical protein
MSFLNGESWKIPESTFDERSVLSTERGTRIDSRTHSGLIVQCANPGCHSGWLHLFRKRTRPMFEGGWSCSPQCTEARLQLAVRREFAGWVPVEEPHRHRIPIGLLMLEQGSITSRQLRQAIDAQKKGGNLRIGEWLVKQGATDEATVSRALGVQWGCPVLSLADFSAEAATGVMPRLFLEVFKVLPIRVAAHKILYLGFEERVDSALALSAERMTGLRVESGVVQTSAFKNASAQILNGPFPQVQFAEAVSGAAAAHLLAKFVERLQPAASRLVRVHEWLWLRMFLKPQDAGNLKISLVRDVICTIGPF